MASPEPVSGGSATEQPINLISEQLENSFSFSRAQSSRLAVVEVDPTAGGTLILSSCKCCLLTTQTKLSPSGLLFSFQPAPALAQLVQKNSSVYQPGRDDHLGIRVSVLAQDSGWKSMTGMKRGSETLPFGSTLPFYQLEPLAKTT